MEKGQEIMPNRSKSGPETIQNAAGDTGADNGNPDSKFIDLRIT